MGRSKLQRFQINSERENIIEPGKGNYETIKGNWHSHFKNDHPLILEIGCGRAEYTTGIANLFPNKNIIGIDIKGSRLWKGSSVAIENGLKNTAFLRTQAQHLERFFGEDEVEEIWITFPDPRPKERDDKNRLTSPRYLNMYKNILVDGGILNFKTDNKMLFDFTMTILKANESLIENLEFTYDLYNSPLAPHCYNIQTTFELKYLNMGTQINYLRCSFKQGNSQFLFP